MRIMLAGTMVNPIKDVEITYYNAIDEPSNNFDLYKKINPQLIIEVDSGCTTSNGRDFLSLVSRSMNTPRIFYSFDAFYDNGRGYYKYAEYFDYVFTVDSWLGASFHPKRKTFFLPFGLTFENFPKDAKKIYDCIFFGSVNDKEYAERKPYVDALQKEFGAKFYFNNHQGYGVHAMEYYFSKMSESKVGVNLAWKDHLSLRPFETLATKQLLVTTPMTDIANIESMSDRCYVVNNPVDMVNKVKELILNYEEESKKLEDNYKWVMEKNTITKRIAQIIETIQSNGSI